MRNNIEGLTGSKFENEVVNGDFRNNLILLLEARRLLVARLAQGTTDPDNPLATDLISLFEVEDREWKH